ncbi:hypothetical protein SFC65_19810 [Priestia filamentosa]|uniref:hypothetical protein n=1 Tax=Priestia filamentosa TaxID=1402861 RepID=UPI003981DF22
MTTATYTEREQLGFFLEDNTVNPTYEGIKKAYTHPNELQPGDYIRVTLSNGYTSLGIYSFSGPRINVKGITHFYERTTRYFQGKRIDLETREFAEFQTEYSKVELLERNYVSGYQVPSQENVLGNLIAELKKVPLKDRLDTYRSFTERYPKYEEEWNELLSKAWNAAIEYVTTEEEVIDYIKNVKSAKEISKKNYAPYVQAYIDRIFENGEKGKKVQILTGMVWTKEAYITQKKETILQATRFSKGGMFEKVYGKVLETTTDRKLFYRVLDFFGMVYQDAESLKLKENYIRITPTNGEKETMWIKKTLLPTSSQSA